MNQPKPAQTSPNQPKPAQPREVSVDQASKFLACSQRSVLNYINKKEIEAIKVGKYWHINFISLQAFKKRYGFNEGSPPEPSFSQGEELPAHQFHVNEEALSIDSSEEVSPLSSKQKYRPLHSLRCYQISCQAFGLDGWQNQITEAESQRVDKLKAEVLEYLGAGFYSYENREKVRYYNRARAALGSIVALLSISQAKRERWSRELSVLESQVIPACSALIRKIEKKIT